MAYNHKLSVIRYNDCETHGVVDIDPCPLCHDVFFGLGYSDGASFDRITLETHAYWYARKAKPSEVIRSNWISVRDWIFREKNNAIAKYGSFFEPGLRPNANDACKALYESIERMLNEK